MRHVNEVPVRLTDMNIQIVTKSDQWGNIPEGLRTGGPLPEETSGQFVNPFFFYERSS